MYKKEVKNVEKITHKLFSDYLSEQKIASNPSYSALAKAAFNKEKELRKNLSSESEKLFEELMEISSEIHFLEVQDAFVNGCKMGAKVTKELII